MTVQAAGVSSSPQNAHFRSNAKPEAYRAHENCAHNLEEWMPEALKDMAIQDIEK